MPDPNLLQSASEAFLDAALLGEGWEDALHRLARAAGAKGANLIVARNGKSVGGFASPDVAATQSRYYGSAHPPDSRELRVRVGLHSGFRIDTDDFTADELKTDPYYQEFLRPEGLFWHATAMLATDGEREIEISVKRPPKCKPFDHTDVSALDAILPSLRASARIARCSRDAETRALGFHLLTRGTALFAIDGWQRVVHETGGVADGQSAVLVSARRKLLAFREDEQQRLDEAIVRAVRQPGRQAVVRLTGPSGERCMLQFVPLAGRARDVFGAAVALAVLIGEGVCAQSLAASREMLRDAFRLTERESRIAVLIGSGKRIEEIARTLGIGIGTIRNHIKSIYSKTGTSRLPELVAFLGCLRP